jgi:deoxyribonuclease-4
MRIGAHVSDNDPVTAATQRNATAVQFFLTDPQSWTPPRPHLQGGLVVHGGHLSKGEDPVQGVAN